MELTLEVVRELPKVLLHDHLDGGLRPETVLELAAACGYRKLPSDDPDELATHLHRGADRRDLGLYLEMFRHTVGVMQTADALHRVTRECVQDLAADGVVYAEIRFAPELHVAEGLTLEAVAEAVLDGLDAGQTDTGMVARLIFTTMRSQDLSGPTVDLALRLDDPRIVAFDLAGQEQGHPASEHAAAIRRALDAGLRVTIHAGEAAGVDSIADALSVGAERLGHGVRLVDDLLPDGELGPVATVVRESGIALEVCPSSNVHTGAADTFARHPIDRLFNAGLHVTVNTDNRLMSNVTLSGELFRCVEAFGWSPHDLYQVTATAARSVFADEPTRSEVVERVRSGFRDIGVAETSPSQR